MQTARDRWQTIVRTAEISEAGNHGELVIVLSMLVGELQELNNILRTTNFDKLEEERGRREYLERKRNISEDELAELRERYGNP